MSLKYEPASEPLQVIGLQQVKEQLRAFLRNLRLEARSAIYSP